MSTVRPLRSTVISRFIANMSPSDSRRDRSAVMHSRIALRPYPRPDGPPRFLDWSIPTRCPQPPRRARRVLASVTSTPVTGFSDSERMATLNFHLHNEAESGSLTLRLAGSPHEASTSRLLGQAARLATCRTGNNMVNTSQFTRPARLILAHQSFAEFSRSRFRRNTLSLRALSFSPRKKVCKFDMFFPYKGRVMAAITIMQTL